MFTIDTTLKKDDEKDIIYIKGWFGTNFRKVFFKRIKEKKMKSLFIEYGSTGFSFYSFFELEVRELFKDIVEDTCPKVKVDIKSFQKAYKLLLEKKEKEVMSNFKFDYNLIEKELKFKILPEQEKAFDFYELVKGKSGLRGGMLDAGVGTGKTFMSLALSVLLKADRIIVFSPLTAVERPWLKSLKEEVYKKEQLCYTSIEFDKKKYKGEKFVVIGYSQNDTSLKKSLKIAQEFRSNNTVIIVDEFHKFNELNTERTKLLKKLCDIISPEDIILLTGTSIKAKPLEIVPMLRILDKRFNATIEKRFIDLYRSPSAFLFKVLPLRFNVYKTIIKKKDTKLPPLDTEPLMVELKNEKEYRLTSIADKMKLYMEERTLELQGQHSKYEALYRHLVDKASKIAIENEATTVQDLDYYRQTIETIIDRYDNGRLKEVSEEIMYANQYEKSVLRPYLNAEEKKQFNDAKTIVKYLNLKVRGEVLSRVVMRERINCHRDMALNIDYDMVQRMTTKKVIYFTSYTEVADITLNKLSTYKPVPAFGKYTKNLPRYINEFVEKEEVGAIVASLKSLAEAVPLVEANLVVFLDMPFRAYIYEQAVARAHRKGQDSPVMVLQIVLKSKEPNINSRNIDIIKWSKEMVELITGEDLDVDLGEPSLEKYTSNIETMEKEKELGISYLSNSW